MLKIFSDGCGPKFSQVSFIALFLWSLLLSFAWWWFSLIDQVLSYTSLERSELRWPIYPKQHQLEHLLLWVNLVAPSPGVSAVHQTIVKLAFKRKHMMPLSSSPIAQVARLGAESREPNLLCSDVGRGLHGKNEAACLSWGLLNFICYTVWAENLEIRREHWSHHLSMFNPWQMNFVWGTWYRTAMCEQWAWQPWITSLARWVWSGVALLLFKCEKRKRHSWVACRGYRSNLLTLLFSAHMVSQFPRVGKQFTIP